MDSIEVVSISQSSDISSQNTRRRSTRNRVPVEKPWLSQRKSRSEKLANWLPLGGVVAGVLLTAYYVYAGYASVPQHTYCLVLEDDFTSFDQSVWSHEVTLGGNGNGEFQYYTDDVENSFVKDGYLHIVPTINDVEQVNGNVLNITGTTCTDPVLSNCVAVVNSTVDTIINPVKSARITTKKSKSIKYGRVEVRAKLPKGDWMWPAIWLLPEDNVYGDWPASGEIDIMESRGNLATNVKSGGVNEIESTLHWGPSALYDQYWRTTQSRKALRGTFADDFHVFGLEWSEDYMYTFIDSRLAQVLYLPTKKSFWNLGKFSGSNIIDPWVAGAANAPFDQSFYLLLNVAVGGNNGFFSDSLTKPWQNSENASAAMSSFWSGRQQWEPTWSNDTTSRGMTVDYVKMWQQCDK